MGDRANVVVLQHHGEGDPQKVYLYTHWGGCELPFTLQKALERGVDRWDDEPYLTRIIFNQMTEGIEMEETGIGISTYLTDNEHPLLLVDCKDKLVSMVREKDENSVLHQWPFDSFVALKKEELEGAFAG